MNDIKKENWYDSYVRNSRIVTRKKHGTHENDILDLVIKPKNGKHTSWDNLCFPEMDSKRLNDPYVKKHLAGHDVRVIKNNMRKML